MNLKMKSGMTALTLVALAGLGAGCAKPEVGDAQTQRAKPEVGDAQTQRAKPEVGDAQTQRASVELGMTNADYVKNGQVKRSVYLTHAISDADLDWTLGLLAGAKNSLVRARAMTILAQVHPLTAAQKSKIAPAIAPFLSSTDVLENLLAQRINRSL